MYICDDQKTEQEKLKKGWKRISILFYIFSEMEDVKLGKKRFNDLDTTRQIPKEASIIH